MAPLKQNQVLDLFCICLFQSFASKRSHSLEDLVKCFFISIHMSHKYCGHAISYEQNRKRPGFSYVLLEVVRYSGGVRDITPLTLYSFRQLIL